MPTVHFASLFLLALPAAASAQVMNAETFYKKATALQAKGLIALFSSDLKLLMNEAKAATGKARDVRRAAISADHKPRYCPSGKGHGMNSDEFMKGMSAIPSAERARIDMTEATTRVLARRFPCPA